MQKKLKVLMVGSNLRVANGVASFQMNYLRHIKSSDVQFDFALLDDIHSPYNDEVKQFGGKIFVLPSIKNIFKHIEACKKIIENGNYDIIHDNTLNKTIPLMMIAKIKKVPVRILHSHSSELGETKLKKFINKALLPILKVQVNANYACSDVAAKCIFQNKEYKFIPNGIEMKKYQPNKEKRIKIRKSFNCEDKIVIGTVGRVSLQKNPFFAFDVIKELLKSCNNLEYWWIGTGGLDEKAKQYACDLEIENHVKFFGNRSDVCELYQAFDLFFMPSLFEGLPVTVVEAQAAHLPCVLSDTITKEVKYSNKLFYLSLNESRTYWANKILDILNSTDNIMIENNRFDIDSCANILLDDYRNLLEKRKDKK